MPFETLLITTDGSEPAEAAARRGFDLAAQLEAAVHVLSVADSSLATGAGYSGDSPHIRERLRNAANDRATSLQREAAERGLDATAVIREGIPATQIADYADEGEIDGIVIGTSGRGGVARAVMGSVADKVVRTASVPVITLNPAVVDAEREASPIDSVLLPTDGSAPAEAAATRGVELAAQLGATVHLLSVVDAEATEELEELFDDAEANDRPTARTDDPFEALVTEARNRGVDCVTVTREGRPAEEIVDYATEARVGGIVMGTHGRGGIERLIVGSVADAVVRRAPVPVVTIRSENEPATDPQ